MKEDANRSLSPAPKGEVEKISYAESVQRRLKSLKKRLNKIEKTEELKVKGAQLNQDQIHSISQKNEVLFAIHELEELAKGFVAIDEEVLNEQKKLQVIQEEREKELLRQAKVEETKQRCKDLENYYILLHVMDPNLQEAFLTNQIDEFSLNQEHIEILIHMYSQIFPKFEHGSRVDQTVSVVFENALKLFNKSKEELRQGVTYSSVYELLESIKKCAYFDPEVASRIASERAAREAEERRKKFDLEENYDLVESTEVPLPSPLSIEQINGPRPVTFQFMTDSELGEELPPPLSSFNLQAGQQPTVIVPVPEKLLGQNRLAPWAKTEKQPNIQVQQQPQPVQQQQQQQQQQQVQESNEKSQVQGQNQHAAEQAEGGSDRRQQYDRTRKSHHYQGERSQDGAPRRSSAYSQPNGQNTTSGPRPQRSNNGNYRPREGQQGQQGQQGQSQGQGQAQGQGNRQPRPVSQRS